MATVMRKQSNHASPLVVSMTRPNARSMYAVCVLIRSPATGIALHYNGNPSDSIVLLSRAARKDGKQTHHPWVGGWELKTRNTASRGQNISFLRNLGFAASVPAPSLAQAAARSGK